ncbi:MAG: sensor domain-containing diguanylate cyclase [Clostridia bacterium]|nr:sensor domain-containing diguanylate cyclase [Clostridia bacterium]
MDSLTISRFTKPFLSEYCHTAQDGLFLVGDCTSLADLLGFSAAELSQKSLADFIAPPKDSTLSYLYEQIRSGEEIELYCSLLKKDGSSVNVLNRGRVVVSDGQRLVHGVLVVAEDSCRMMNHYREELEQCRAELRQKETMMDSYKNRAEQDSLTGLFNARTTRYLCEEYLSNPCTTSCAMIMIDVDDFKRINDRYGHMIGDYVLTSATATIKRLFRANDIVGRIGGDEFLVLMKDVSDPAIVELRCSQIVSAFNAIQCEAIENETLGCSVGAVLSGTPNTTYETLFCNADKLMYRCKRAGGNRYTIQSAE